MNSSLRFCSYFVGMIKLLIIEDSDDLREMLILILQKYKYEVVALSEAINVSLILSKFNADLVLIDVWLRNTSGKEICKKIKELRRDLPVILMSANPKLLADYKSCDADDILEKPFEIKTLLHKIDSALSKKERVS